jgi:hypothetical protein
MNATYDGKRIVIDGEVMDKDDERRELITHVAVNAGVKTIGKDAFRDCTKLSSVVLPEGLSALRTVDAPVRL